jgi:endoglucanase
MSLRLSRRKFVKNSALAAAACAVAWQDAAAASTRTWPQPTAARLPRWRGFNLLEKFWANPEGNPPFRESDFDWMAQWGFDFVRLPMSYRCWTNPANWLELRDAELRHVDQAVEFGHQYGVHVNLNFHRAPGYCVNPPAEPLDLWKDAAALDACAFHWAHFAKRFKGIPNARVSFDLLNEPANIEEPTYVRIVTRLVEAIRAEDAGRLILADGLSYGNKPVPGLAGLKIAQSAHNYEPFHLTHYRASWVNGQNWPEPAWPLHEEGKTWDRARLREAQIKPWKAIEAAGVGVHVGEWGAYQYTPHKVVLAWMRDCLTLWKEAGWGWALWNFRGSFGVLDSERQDVAYEDFHGHKLDREMLALLQTG